MLSQENLKEIEQIICYQFHNKDLLIKLFEAEIPYDEFAYRNGSRLFWDFIGKQCENKIFKANSYYWELNHNGKIEYNEELFKYNEEPLLYWCLQKNGLNKYLHFNENTDLRLIYDFVYYLINAVSIDCNENWTYLTKTISKLVLYDYVLSDPFFPYNSLNWEFAFNSKQCNHAILEIKCPKLLTYSHQNASDIYTYLSHYFVDLCQKTAKDYPKLNGIWTKVNFQDDFIPQFEKIALDHELNVGYLYLHDEYYWYCLAFASKFSLAFFAKSEKKEAAVQLVVTAFIKHYSHLDNNDDDENKLCDKGIAVDLATLFFNSLLAKLDLHLYDKSKLQGINWKDMNKNHLISQLNNHQIFNLQVFQKFDTCCNCLLFVRDIPIAFSANGTNESNALTNTCDLLIKHYVH